MKENNKNNTYQFQSKSLNQYYEELSKYPILSIEEETELLKKIAKNDKKAKTKLINSNLRLVWSIANEFKIEGGEEIEDLITYGNQGLNHAVETFSLEYNTKFSTHAYYCIKGYILSNIKKNHKLINVPESIKKNQKAVNEILNIIGSNSSIDQIYEYAKNNNIDLSYDEVNEAIIHKYYLEYTDDINNPGYEIGQNNVETPNEYITKIYFEEELQKVMEEFLTKNEQYVLIHSFGLDGLKTKTLQAIGNDLRLTKERIRQLRNTALNKLRINAPQLENYLNNK